jgi:hypothetical protein
MAKPKKESLSDALTTAATAVVGVLTGKPAETIKESGNAMSPGKRAQVSGQYLEHLEKLKKLQDSGVLSTFEFEEQKKFMLTNIKKLNSP